MQKRVHGICRCPYERGLMRCAIQTRHFNAVDCCKKAKRVGDASLKRRSHPLEKCASPKLGIPCTRKTEILSKYQSIQRYVLLDTLGGDGIEGCRLLMCNPLIMLERN